MQLALPQIEKTRECLRFRTLPGPECLPLRETCGLDLAKLGVLALHEGVGGPTDFGEGGAVLAGNGCHIHRASFAVQHGAYGIITEPLRDGG